MPSCGAWSAGREGFAKGLIKGARKGARWGPGGVGRFKKGGTWSEGGGKRGRPVPPCSHAHFIQAQPNYRAGRAWDEDRTPLPAPTLAQHRVLSHSHEHAVPRHTGRTPHLKALAGGRGFHHTARHLQLAPVGGLVGGGLHLPPPAALHHLTELLTVGRREAAFLQRAQRQRQEGLL